MLLHIRFLAVAVLLAGMAYVMFDTQQQVRKANDDRDNLRRTVVQLDQRVKALTADNLKKSGEIKRLTGLLMKAGVDPRPPSPTPAPAATSRRTATPSRTSGPRPSPTRSSRPQATPKATRSPSASPSPTCRHLPIAPPVPLPCLATDTA
jgi:hypothetical protein